MFSSLEFYSQSVIKYESKFFKFSECTVSKIFSSYVQLLRNLCSTKINKTREESYRIQEKKLCKRWKRKIPRIIVKGDVKQELSFSHAEMEN